MSVPNRGPELQAVGYTLVVAAFIAICLRIYCRAVLIRSFGFDDWAMMAAMVFFALFVACALVGVEYGTGRHREDINNEDHYAKAMMYWWYCYLWYCTSMVCSKISVGWFLLRITVRKWDIIIIWGVLATTVLTGMVFFFVTLFQCKPISYFWEQRQDGSCVSPDVIIALTYLYSACSVICDFTFALLPVWLIWSLNLKKSHKLALIPIVLMACIASTAVLVRFHYVKGFKDPDFLWATLDIALWSTTEQGLAITAGSLATLRPLFRALSSKLPSYGNAASAENTPHYRGPSTIGGSDPRRKNVRGPFSMATFITVDDEATSGGSGGEIEKTQRTSVWSSRKMTGDSEEELTSASSNGIWTGQKGKSEFTVNQV